MRLTTTFLFLTLIYATRLSAQDHPSHIFKYTNPITRDTAISMRDHFIIRVGPKWYCVGTSNPVWTGHNPGVRLLVSPDLIHWKQQGWLIDASKLSADCPYNGRFWAPEIHYIKHKYWLTMNSGKVTPEDPKGMKTHSIWLFCADSVTGPYKLVNGPLTPQYNNDATLFEDDDGQTYLYCSGNGLFQAKIDLPTGKLITPHTKIFRQAIARQSGMDVWRHRRAVRHQARRRLLHVLLYLDSGIRSGA